jgi:hypothetical protein
MRCRSGRLQRLMAEFMEKNYREWEEVCGRKGPSYSRFASNGYPDSSRLSYDHAKSALGFDFNCGEPERDYIFAVTRWMALKVGTRRTYRDVGLVPFYVYDGGAETDSYWPILVDRKDVPADRQWCVCTRTGFQSVRRKYDSILKSKDKTSHLLRLVGSILRNIDLDIRKIDELMSGELDRLDSLWQKSLGG